MRFENHEIAFDVPDDWTDQSMTTFVFSEAGTRLTLTQTKPTRATLSEQTEALVEQLETVFPHLKVLKVREAAAGPAPAVRLDVEWKLQGIVIRNMIALTLHDGIVWSLTATTPKERVTETEPVITRAIASFCVKPT